MSWQRSAGILLHPTCLSSPYGVGNLGPLAASYVGWLASAGISWWQVLPLNPPGPGNSPYSATSTFAGNPLLISPEPLIEERLLVEDDLAGAPAFPEYMVDYATVIPWKQRLLAKAYARFKKAPPPVLAEELVELKERHQSWLDDFALFTAIKTAHKGLPWYQWPTDLAMRRPSAIKAWKEAHEDEIAMVEMCQLLFFRQWRSLRTYANESGLQVLGDIPIFVAYDSADVWSHPELFKLDKQRRPTVVAGVPPDYFSETGQLWGNPVYDWAFHTDDGFSWWIDRVRHSLELYDAVRLDHFRGFVAHWEVPADHEVASKGRWVDGPGQDLFDALSGALGELPFMAEDLGHITEDVNRFRDQLGFPGMAVLQFAFSPSPRSLFIPYSHQRNQVVYTGTHDNNTSLGWFLEDADREEKELLLSYADCADQEISWEMIRLALASVAHTAIIPHQDLAGLGADCRMNTPGVADGNWKFRITPWMLDDKIHDRLAEMVETYGRVRS
jgi:4-alpha-glucanotransferase